MTATDARTELLLRMYDQMFNDINRHILVVWQGIGVVIGAFALFSLVEKQLLPLDIAVALLVVLCGWMLSQLYDSAYWYNRNLVIIANIEREFLAREDLTLIHFYFGRHREKNKPILHLRIQRFLALGIAALVLAYHFYVRVRPGLGLPMSEFNFLKALPYFALAAAALFVNHTRNDRDDAYETFVLDSPGRDLGIPRTNKPGHGMLRSFSEILWLCVRIGKGKASTSSRPSAPDGLDDRQRE